MRANPKDVWSGPKYRRAQGAQNDWPSLFFEKVNVAPAYSILQVSFGGRDLTARLAELAPDGHVLAVDFGEAPFREAMADKRFPARGNVTFLTGDPCALPSQLPGAPFDVVMSHMAAERCPNMTRLFHRLIRLARQDGQVYMEMAGEGDCQALRDVMDNMASGPFAGHFMAFRYPYRPLSRNEALEIVTEAGYGRPAVEMRKETVRINSGYFPIWLAANAGAPYIQNLPQSQHSPFIDSVVKNYPPGADGCFAVERVILSVHGHRYWGSLEGDLMGGPVGMD
ncbi:MAG: methyltransferase domain-containing protein [Nitrospinae bacterium]|nr:methyltransferase domain-containing protein [Nitrospinota bacterium]